jgi:FecR protein
MTKLGISKAMASLSVLLLATAMQAQNNDANQPATAATGNSKVRIVRLSEVRGDVQIKHESDRGFEKAMANLPIVEQSRLRTGTGVAEVEFEDNSTIRLGPDSVIEFPQLERLSTGKTATSVHLIQGIAYVSLLKTPGNQFTLAFGERKLDLPPATHIRLQIDGSDARLAVLDGTVNMDSPSGVVNVTKKKTATFSIMGDSQPTIVKDVASSELDSWDHDAVGYHSRVASNSMLNSPYAYGQNDMNYYGSFNDAGGCGSMWRPYFASAAWNPYSNGSWAWYPGAGYSWVSPYPWGWTPFHYGSWSYCAGSGWGWMPGGSWNGLVNGGMMAPSSGSGIVPPGGPGTIPHPPVHAPRLGEPTHTAVNLKPLVQSGISSPSSFAFRKDSAGLGVPRDTLGRLDKLSRQANNRGIASTPVYVNAPSAPNGRMNNNSEMLGASIHRGAPDQGFQEPMQAGGQGSTQGGGSYSRPASGAMHPSGNVGGSGPSPGPGAGAPGARPHQ